MMLLQIDTPIPKDIPLPLPMPEWVLVLLLIISFLLHIVFIKLMVGGSLVALWAQIKGLKDKEYDTLAHEIAKTITVNKSLAVVMGVAPLLTINTLYTVYFYSANALTGFAWILIIPLVTIAFLLTYLHKYTWDTLANNRRLHIGILGIAVLIFLAIPFIFLTNVNLMMFPEKWMAVKGFLSALLLPNVFPRYFEFLGACLTITGIFFVWYNRRVTYPVGDIYEKFDRLALQKIGYSIAVIGLSLQIIFGIIVMLTLPSKGVGFDVISLMLLAGSILVLILWFSFKAIQASKENIGKDFKKILALTACFLLIYGGSRQLYRQNALSKHQALVKAHTAEFQKQSLLARQNPVEEEQTLVIDESLGEVAKGAAVFNSYCAACHKPKEKLVGPPISEMAKIYANNETDLIKWIKAPGKKRADYPQMPGFPQISDADLKELSKYILTIK